MSSKGKVLLEPSKGKVRDIRISDLEIKSRAKKGNKVVSRNLPLKGVELAKA